MLYPGYEYFAIANFPSAGGRNNRFNRLLGKVQERGFTLVPLSLYFSDEGRVKVELALARGKHTYDKRETIKRREADRDADRSIRRGTRR